MMYVGLDVHKRFCHGTVMDEDGEIVKQGRFGNDPLCLGEFLEGFDDASVVLEAGYGWQPVYDRLEEEGYGVKLAHPLKTKMIAEAKVKTDKMDSEVLAHLLRADLIPESWVPPKEIRDLRGVVKHRSFLVRIRTRLKNRIHGELAKRNIHFTAPLFTRQGKASLKSFRLECVNQLLEVIDVLDRQINEASAKIHGLAMENQDAMLLTTIPGIGYYTALLLVAEIGDINRFPDAEKLCSYAGLVPSVHQSGNKTVYGSITKQGSKWIRWALTQAAHVHVKHDTRLSRFYHRLAEKKRETGCCDSHCQEDAESGVLDVEGERGISPLRNMIPPRCLACGFPNKTALARLGAHQA